MNNIINLLLLVVIMINVAIAGNTQPVNKIVIAHRGASGYLPEHTLPAKVMAYAQGADFLEQDLVMTKDDQLVVLHDHHLDRLTNVADKFPGRARSDGRFYAIDFTLAEIKSLYFTETLKTEQGKRIKAWPNQFPIFNIHTFEEEIEFIQRLNKSTGKNIGLYPEIKAPWFHRHEGKDISSKALTILKSYGYTDRNSNIYLQCFDPIETKRLKMELMPKIGVDLKLIQLIAYTDWEETFEITANNQLINYSYDWMFKLGAMIKIAQYADGIGPQYSMLVEKNSTFDHVNFTPMVNEAHASGLLVHPYTLRADLIPPYAKDMSQLLDIILNRAGADGVFSDYPDLAVQFLQQHNQHH